MNIYKECIYFWTVIYSYTKCSAQKCKVYELKGLRIKIKVSIKMIEIKLELRFIL